VPEPQSQPLVRAMLAFRALLTIVIAGADFLIPWTPSPLAWLTVLVSVLTIASLLARRPLRMIAVEAWLLPVLLLAGGIVDTRVLHLVPQPNPLDGYAIGTMSVVGAVWGWRTASRLLLVTLGVEVALAVADVGVGVDALVLLSQRATWLVVAAAGTSYIGSQTAAAAAAVAAEAEGQERLTHLRALHDRAVQTLTAVVVGAAGGWERIRREAPGLWERVRGDAAAERDRLLALEADDPAPAAADVVRAVVAVVRAHRQAPAVQLRTHGLPVVPSKVAAAVAQAVDEALTNVAKHAPGATVTVTIDGARGRVEVRVEDTGAAGEIHAAPRRRAVEGFGISQSLRGRMAAVGGSADVTSQAGVGTTVSVSWCRVVPGWRWPGAAGVMPRRACRGIIVAAVGWHLTGSLSVLFVAWQLGWLRWPVLALGGVLLPAVLLLGGVLVPAVRGVVGRVRAAVVPGLLVLGPAMVALGGVLVMPGYLVRDYADPMTITGATCTAVVTFLAGGAMGAVALATSSLAVAVAAPLLNGATLPEVATITTVERLVSIFVAWFLFVRIGPLLSESVTARRRAAVMRARVAESAAISDRLAPLLAVIAKTATPGDVVRRQAFVALAWARLRLTGTSQPGEERVVDALAAVAAWHPAVRRPPQIVRIAGAPPAATVSRAAHALDVVLGVLDEADARAITVTAAGGSAELRVRVACRLADRPSPGVVGDLRRTLEHRVHRVDVHDDGDGVQVVIAVRADGQVAHRVPVAVAV
jgi:signal transduction histidine kinase